MATTALKVKNVDYRKIGQLWYKVVPQEVKPPFNMPVVGEMADLLQQIADEKDAKPV